MTTAFNLSLEVGGAFLRAAGLRLDRVAGDLATGAIEATAEHGQSPLPPSWHGPLPASKEGSE